MRDFRIQRLADSESRIDHLIEAMDRFDLTPDYQRQADLWNIDKKQLFIDSLINGYDVPKLYFHRKPPNKSASVEFAIIDGKQRLLTIREFIKNAFELSDDFIDVIAAPDLADAASGKTFQQLTRDHPSLASRLLHYQLDIVVIETADEYFIEEMFTRLNEALALNAPEKRNAFGGAMPPIIRRLATQHEFFTDRLPIENRRYKHYDLATKFLFLADHQSIVSTKKRSLDEFVKQFRTSGGAPKDLGLARGLAKEVRAILDRMVTVFVPEDELLSSIGLVTVYFVAFQKAQARNGLAEKLTRDRLLEFDQIRHHNREVLRLEQQAIAGGRKVRMGRRVRRDLAVFDRLMQSPNDGTALEYRYRILVSFLNDREFKESLPKALRERIGTK